MDESTPSKVKPRRRDPDDTRAERKRIQDRLAQRATRERTKNRIAYLEERLSSLESGDKQGEIASLTRIIDNLRQDNNRLRSAMLKIRTNIDQAVLTTEDQSRNLPPETKPCGCEAKSDCSCAQTPYQHSEPFHPRSDRHGSISTESDVTEVINGPSVGVNLNVAAPGPDTISHFTGLEDFFDFSPTSLLETFEMGPTAWNTTTPSPYDFHFPSSETSTRIVPDLDKWDVSNGAFVSCLNSVKRRQGSASPSTPDLHVPFKAAIWGWDNVGPEAQHPVWAALRQVDQQVFGTWTSKAQRIALMYVCQTLIQYREHPTKENLDRVPVFLRPRPSQETIQHPAVIDFLIWPGLRDRLVFEHKKYTSTGAFSAAFVGNFNFYWPYSDRDIFAYSPENNRYEISKIFLEYAYNFKNWTMKPSFFKKFPEMQHDIAATEEPVEFPRASWNV